MKLVSTTINHAGNVRLQRVTIWSDTQPAALPQSGADVDGLGDDVSFDVMSALLYPSAVLFYGEDGQWHEWG